MSIARVRRFFSAHPLLFLILLAPQVEYFTGSSQLSWLVGNPPFFFAFFAQNLGSYGLAVVLIREASVRWQKGWASIILLGAAYGILNEGVGAATLFNPDSSAFGILGSYGRWLGVNWVWATGLVMLVHPLFSVSLPLFEHRLALPEIRGKSLVGNLGLSLAFVGLGIDAVGTLIFVGTVRHYFAGPILWTACGVGMAAFVLAAGRVPKDLIRLSSRLPRVRAWRFFLLGALFIWAVTLGGDFLANLGVVPEIVMVFFVVSGSVSLMWVFGNVGKSRNEKQRIALGAGLVVSLIPMGFLGQLDTGIGEVPVVVVDLLAVLFFVELWKKYKPISITRLPSSPL